MLITIVVADTYKLANHYTDPTATYISGLKVNNIMTKKGVASDTCSFSIETIVLDYLGETFTYLCYDTPVKLYIDELLIIDGYIDKIANTVTGRMNISILATQQWQLKQFLSPTIESNCQNQVYSENCGLEATDYNMTFTTVLIDCFNGGVTLDLSGGVVTLGGVTSIGGNDIFLDRSMWWNAIIFINGIYRTTVVNVTDEKIYLGINYLDLTVLTTSLTVVLKCDKTYGECYKRFSNTKNFWGFPNTGNKVQTIDIFSASELTFCGDDLQEQEWTHCDTDFNIFGINIGEEI